MASLMAIWNTPAPADTVNKARLFRDSMVEFVATTLFIYSGTLSAVSTGQKLVGQGSSEDVGRILPIAMSFGVSILALAFAIGHLTGGHMNPGVSLLMFFRREMSLTKMLCYWTAQFTASLLASSLVWGSTSEISGTLKADGSTVSRPPYLLGSTTLNDDISPGNGFMLEFMGSFVFYFVIAQTALDKRGISQTPFPAIPIGLVLVVVHICLIPFTGCGVNPARTFGPSMITCMANSDDCDAAVGDWYWIYWIGPFMASFFVAETTMLMKMSVGDEDEDDVNDTHDDIVVDETEKPMDDEGSDEKKIDS